MLKTVPFRARLIHEAKSKSATIEVLDDIRPHFGCGVVELNEQLKAAGKVDEINVLIHSRGGSAVEGFAMHSLLVMHEATVNVEIIGLAASAASTIAMAGDKIRISQVGQIMIHDPWLYASGNAARLRFLADKLEQLTPSIVSAYLRHAEAKGTTEEQLRAWMSEGEGAGRFFSAEKALEVGLAHEIIKGAPAPQNRIDLEGLDGLPDDIRMIYEKAGRDPEGKKEPAASSFADQILSGLKQSRRGPLLSQVLNGLETPQSAPDEEEEVLHLVQDLLATSETSAPSATQGA